MPTFEHGVASGDPLGDRVVLWTRVSGVDGDADVSWSISREEDLSNPVSSGTTTTGPDRDHTVKVDATGLEPGNSYFYGFEFDGEDSPTGRTSTLPDDPQHLTFAVTSCAKYTAGYFNAYDRIAERDEIDFWLHLGDYIYEYPTDDGKAIGPEIGRRMDPQHECRSLEDYRKRYALHHRDEMVQNIHLRHPMIAICDDHEFCNDTWRDGAKNHDEEEDGPWADRKAAALKAWTEWLPVRVEGTPLNRSFAFGDLADVILIDTRTERDEMVKDPEKLNDPERTLLGKEQREWLLGELSDSDARWKIVAGGVMVGQVSTDLMPQDVGDPLSELGILTRNEHGPNPDQWDGYPAERDRVFDHIDKEGIEDVVFLSGDVHSSWAVDLKRDPDDGEADPIAVEFVVTSLTSENLDEELGEDRDKSPEIEGHVREANPHIQYCELDDHGYMIVAMSPERLTCRWHYVDDIHAPCKTETAGPGFEVNAGSSGLRAMDD